MDIPTYIILFSFVISILLVLFLKLFQVSKVRSRTILLGSFSAIWIIITIFGELIYTWAGNSSCLKYLGCVTGFAGYDAFEHLFFGVALVILIVWLCEHFPKYCITHPERWKTALIVVAVVVFISVLWEILECTHDALRMNVLHESLRNFSLNINLLDQPTNIDTMGDLSFGLVGAIVGFFLSL